MTSHEISHQIHQKRSFLCVGLDTDIEKIPGFLKKENDPVYYFNKKIIDATHPFCVAYKINTAFYEAMGSKGWDTMKKTFEYIPTNIFKIADAKRGDIGNTAKQYAKAFFQELGADAVTLSPYMGEDSIKPFLEYPGKWVILLVLTSNSGSKDFQMLKTGNEYLFEKVIKTSSQWGTSENMMYVVGATKPEQLAIIRKIIPHHFLLVPGVGEQGGDLEKVVRAGKNSQCGLLVNVSRGIIYAGSGADFAEKAAEKAKTYKQEMENFI